MMTWYKTFSSQQKRQRRTSWFPSSSLSTIYIYWNYCKLWLCRCARDTEEIYFSRLVKCEGKQCATANIAQLYTRVHTYLIKLKFSSLKVCACVYSSVKLASKSSKTIESSVVIERRKKNIFGIYHWGLRARTNLTLYTVVFLSIYTYEAHALALQLYSAQIYIRKVCY